MSVRVKNLLTKMTEARNYISDRNHWMKGGLHDGKGRYCSIGVINHTTLDRNRSFREKLLDYLKVAIVELKKEGKLGRFSSAGCGADVGIASFNDSRETKHDHVVMAFNRATELLAADLKKEQKERATELLAAKLKKEAESVAPVEEGVYIKMPTKVLEKVG